jgi:hypothetical protein
MGKMTVLDLKRINVSIFTVLIVINAMLASILIFSYKINIRGVESNVIYTIQSTLLDDNSLYTNPEQIPYAISQYMPFYYIVCNKIISSWGLTPGEDVHLVYVICRGLSFCLTILIAFCLGRIMYDVFECTVFESWIVGAFSIFLNVPWFYLARPDVFVSLFAFAALYLFLRYVKEEELKVTFLLFSGFLCFFSFFSKQNGLITFLILASYLFFRFRFKDLSILISGFLLGSLIGYVFYMPYSSAFFMENAFWGVVDNGSGIGYALATYKSTLTKFGMIAFMDFLAIYFLVRTVGIKKLDEKTQLIVYYFVVLLVFSCITSLKHGTAINQFIDTLILSLIVLAIAFRQFVKYYDLNKEIHLLNLLVCLILSFGFTVSIQNYYQYGTRSLKTILTHDNPYSHKIVDFLNCEIGRHDDFYFFSTDRSLNNRFPEKCIFPQPNLVRVCTFPRRTFNYSDFEKKVNNGTIKFYITKKRIFDFVGVELKNKFFFYKKVGKHSIYMNNYYI